jgi:hypothetical protein
LKKIWFVNSVFANILLFSLLEAPGRFGNALAGPSNWMSDFHAVTEGKLTFPQDLTNFT